MAGSAITASTSASVRRRVVRLNWLLLLMSCERRGTSTARNSRMTASIGQRFQVGAHVRDRGQQLPGVAASWRYWLTALGVFGGDGYAARKSGSPARLRHVFGGVGPKQNRRPPPARTGGRSRSRPGCRRRTQSCRARGSARRRCARMFSDFGSQLALKDNEILHAAAPSRDASRTAPRPCLMVVLAAHGQQDAALGQAKRGIAEMP